MDTVIITGVRRGIGKALASMFLKEGYRVIGTSTSGKTEIKDLNLEVLTMDLLKPESIAKAVKEIKAKTDTINILINNAGIGPDEPNNSTEVDVVILRQTLEVNIIGLVDFTEQLLGNITEGGQIINISSMMGQLTTDLGDYALDYPSYRISKTAVNMYTKTLASRLQDRKITVSSVHPGWVKTDMGGEGATREPEVAAEYIYKLSTTPHETGLFWYDNEKFEW